MNDDPNLDLVDSEHILLFEMFSFLEMFLDNHHGKCLLALLFKCPL